MAGDPYDVSVGWTSLKVVHAGWITQLHMSSEPTLFQWYGTVHDGFMSAGVQGLGMVGSVGLGPGLKVQISDFGLGIFRHLMAQVFGGCFTVAGLKVGFKGHAGDSLRFWLFRRHEDNVGNVTNDGQQPRWKWRRLHKNGTKQVITNDGFQFVEIFRKSRMTGCKTPKNGAPATFPCTLWTKIAAAT